MLPFHSLAAIAAAMLMALAAPAAHANTTVDCPYVFLCVGGTYDQAYVIDTSTAVAFGNGARASNDGWAFGNMALATGKSSLAWGQVATASGANSIAFGVNSLSTGVNAVALNGEARSNGSIAIGGFAGYGNDPTIDTYAIAIGGRAYAPNAIAIGGGAWNDNGTVVGTGAYAGGPGNTNTAPNASAFGYQALAYAANSVALGANTVNTEANTVAVGNRRITQVTAGTNPLDAVNVQQLNTAIAGMPAGSAPTWLAATDTSTPATVYGDNTKFRGAVSVGPASAAGNAAGGDYNSAFGYGAQAGLNSLIGGTTAVGAFANAQADNSSTFGAGATTGVNAVNSVSLGALTNTDRANTAAFGNRTLSQVSAGTLADDAVTLGQVQVQANALGGGAGYNAGIFTGPTYSLSSGSVISSFNNVGDSLTYLDTSITTASTAMGNWLGGGAQGGNGRPFYAPTYSLANGTYHDVGSALAGLQSQITNIDTGAGGSAPVWLATDAPTTPANQAGVDEVAVGPGASAGNANTGQNTAIGAGASAGTVGSGAAGTGGQATAVGAHAGADAVGGSSFGQGAYVGPDGIFSVAVGAQTNTDRAFTVAVGNRTVSQMADGTELQDGVTVNQLNNAMAGFGGGASFLGGTFTPPSYIFISGASYNNVGSALADLDGRVHTLENAPSGSGSPGPAGQTGPQGPKGDKGDQGAPGKDGVGGDGTDSMAVHYDSAAKSSVTLGGADANGVAVTPAVTLSNVANGAVNATSTQAVNGAQLYQVKQAAAAYTDQQVSNVQNWAKSYTDNKFAQARRDSDEAGAAGGAIGTMALSASRVSPEYRQGGNLSMATGVYGHAGAIAMGWSQTYDKGRVGVAVAASWTGSHTFVGGSVSIGLDDLF